MVEASIGVAVGNLRVGDARVDLLFVLFARVAQTRERVALTEVKVPRRPDVVFQMPRTTRQDRLVGRERSHTL